MKQCFNKKKYYSNETEIIFIEIIALYVGW